MNIPSFMHNIVHINRYEPDFTVKFSHIISPWRLTNPCHGDIIP